MLKRISKGNIDSFLASIKEVENREAYTYAFWDKIEKTNEDLLDFILGFVENLETDIERTMFLDGLWMMYSLMEREEELQELENLNI